MKLWTILCCLLNFFSIPATNGLESSALRIEEGNTDFGVDFYLELLADGAEGKNLIFSPFSVSSVMAMLLVGSKGNTNKQISENMNFPEDKQVIDGYHDVLSKLKGNDDFTLETANKIYVQENFSINKNFKEVTEKKFLAGTTSINFAASAEASKVINEWVEGKTHNKIKDLLSKEDLNSLTRLVLINAVYFKGNWNSKFKEKDTSDQDFYVNEKTTVKAKQMKQTGKFKMIRFDDFNARAIELPYKGERLSMYIVLPNDKNGLAELEENIFLEIDTESIFDEIDEQGYKQTVYLTLPKFKLEKTLPLGKPLENMGIVDMFGNNADLSGISETGGLYVSKAVQKAFIEVNEEGSEAAAATAAVTNTRMAPRVQRFECNHPFVFFIRDKVTKMVLFMGRVVNPAI